VEKAAKRLAALTAACITEAVAAVEQVKVHLTSAPFAAGNELTGGKRALRLPARKRNRTEA
jgi:hypothetical protein